MPELPKDIQEIENKIAAFKNKQQKNKVTQPNQDNQFKNLIIEFVITLIVSGAFGYFVDQWLKSFPIFLLISLLFGFISGLYVIYKKTKNYV